MFYGPTPSIPQPKSDEQNAADSIVKSMAFGTMEGSPVKFKQDPEVFKDDDDDGSPPLPIPIGG